ncbi:SpoIIE family protein phosphatase [Streptomyces sp. NPDC093509]|uniref:SpoIIE family protein phosphatase n=1 Tax=Streptomyces sp. NPDC093509 TaxID=3154982 RepID=UPI00344F711D
MFTYSFNSHPVADRLDHARLGLIADSGATLGRHLDLVDSAQALTDLLVPRMAIAATVDLCDEFIAEEERSEKMSGGLFRLGATVAPPIASPAQDPRYTTPQCLPIPNISIVRGNANFVNLYCPTERNFRESFGGDYPGFRYVQNLGISSVATVPISVATDASIGLLTIYRLDKHFTSDDLEVAKELATRAGIALKNARTYTCERRRSASLHLSTRPLSIPKTKGLDILERFTDDSDGRWFDVIRLPGARTAVVMGDTSDLGLHAIATAIRLRSAVQALSQLDIAPRELMTRLNELAVRIISELHSISANPRSDGIKCLYLVHDPVQGRCTVANAGHQPPIMISPKMDIEVLSEAQGPTLGKFQEKYSESQNVAEPGTMLTFTNSSANAALTELKALAKKHRSSASVEFGHADIAAAIATPGRVATPVVMRTNAVNSDELAEWNFASDIAVVGTARKLAQQQLNAWGIEDDVNFVTTLIISELVTNAIRHGSEPIKLRLIRQEKLTCEVFDGDRAAPYLQYALPDEEGGRGLFIIAECASRWGIRQQPTGKTIWTEQNLRGYGTS